MKKQRIQKTLIPVLVSIFTIFLFGASGEICGPLFETTADAFEAKFPENKKEAIQPIVDALNADGKPADRDALNSSLVLFTTNTKKSGVVAYDIRKKNFLWEIEVPINSPLTLKHGTFIFQTGATIAAYDAATGTKRWQIPVEEGWSWYGADLTKNIAVLSFGIGNDNYGKYANGKLVAVRLDNGSEIWKNLTGQGLLGTPAVIEDYVFVPWKKKQIAAINIHSGEEISRLRADDFTINFVKATDAGVFYGTNATDQHVAGLFALDGKSISGTRRGSNVFFPGSVPAPNYPAFSDDSFNVQSIEYANSEKIKYYWVPQPSKSRIRLQRDMYYLHYWRYIFAFNARTHQVVWAYMSDEDIHSLHAVESGVYSVTTSGLLRYADAHHGPVEWRFPTRVSLTSAAYDVDRFVPEFAPVKVLPNPREQLKAIILDKDSRMLPARIYATRLLAAIESTDITADLLQMHSDGSLPTALQKTIVEKIAERETGADALIDSLNVRYDYLANVAAPPMHVIAPALANMHDKRALPGLMQQILDFETPATNIEPIAAALLEIGDETIVDPLMQFVTLYHADSAFIGNEAGLSKICEVVLKYGGADRKNEIEKIRDNSQTLPDLQNMLLRILDPDAEKKAIALAIQKAQEAEIARQRAMELRAAQEQANRPYFLSRDEIAAVMSRHAQLLRPCIKNALQKRQGLRQVRMKFIITGATGKPAGLQILPTDIPELQECLAAGLSQIEFPQFKNVRQSASHTIRITGVRRQSEQPAPQ